MARLHKTLADYIAIAISPALIMMMVGSMLFFLVNVFYHGRYDLRIYWILGCFTLAIVLISRISIEEGQERALMYGAALAGATGIAVARFANAFFIPWLLLALAWWSAAKLTWDCTLIDEEQDASGQGLLQIITFGKRRSKQKYKEEKTTTTNEAAQGDMAEPEGVTSRVAKMRSETHVNRQPKGRVHAPGVWIVYFSLSALPMFGLGQLLIPIADIPRRQWAFVLLCCYVGSGLGLLLTTSFLGLRRYLRQRGIEMPNDMATVWMGLGAIMIVVLLFLVVLLPRPAAEYSISKFPLKFTTPERESSRWAPGNDGADKKSPNSQSRTTDEKEQDKELTPASQETSDRSSSDKSESPKRGSSKSERQSPDKNDPGERTDRGQRSNQKTAEQQDDRQSSRRETSSEKQQYQNQIDNNQSDKTPHDMPQPDKNNRDSSESRPLEKDRSKGHRPIGQDERPPREKQDQGSSKPSSQPTQSPSKPWLQVPRVSISSGGILKLILYALLFCVVGYFLWKSRSQVLTAIRQFLQELQEFWARLFGGRKSVSEDIAKETSWAILDRPFSDYNDPFASGLAGRQPPEQIVRYTFEALEAWARENDCRRDLDQTPREFARQIAARHELLTKEVNLLAELYSLVAYAGGRLDARSIEPLAQLWQVLKHGSYNQR